MKSVSYYVGVVTGILVVLALILLVRLLFRSKRAKPEYDERQIAARGEAFRAGYLTLLIYLALYAVLDMTELLRIPPTVGGILGAMAGITAFALAAIRRDAYMGFNEDMRYGVVIIALAGAINLVCGLVAAARGRLFEDGAATVSVINLGMGVLAAIILAALWIHRRKQGEDGDE